MEDGLRYNHFFRKVVSHLVKLQDEMLSPYEITGQQARALGMIHLLRSEQGTVNQKDLETAIGLRGSSIHSLLSGLEKHGYIKRVCGKEDARTKELFLTEKGAEFHDMFIDILRGTEEQAVSGMTETERKQLLHLLQKAAKNLE